LHNRRYKKLKGIMTKGIRAFKRR